MPFTISKSRFVSGCQCAKRLYLQVHEPGLAGKPDASSEAIMEQGREVGLLARRLFPGGIEVNGSGLEQAIRATKELVANPEVPAIFEAAFHYQGVNVKTDILRRKEDRWRLVEVKSTTDLREHHTEDVAIQSYAVSHCLDLGSVWLAHVNRDYVFAGGEIDPQQFFLFRNLTRKAQNLQQTVAMQLRSQFRILSMPSPPDVPPGPHCTDPVVCEFFSHCNPPKPQDYIGYIPRIHASAMEQLGELGVESMRDVPADFELSEFQRRVCTAVQTGQAWFSPELSAEFDSLKCPLYFMDFETINPAIPRFAGMRPYDPLPFQWSVHVLSEPARAPKHYEFLAGDGDDPRHEFAASLCEVLGEKGSVVVYNQQFESQRLWELAGWLPEFAERIRGIQRRLWDLLPVVRNHVYHPAFGGSFSLKAVLPALVPEMSYAGMDVADGQAAGLAWQAMIGGEYSEADRDAKRKALLDYCGQDTLALVRVFEALQARCGA